MSKTLQVSALSKRYGETQALLDVDIQFSPGTVHTIFGENGSGKSTLVKILSGIVQPDAGTIRLGDTVASHFHPRHMRTLGIIPVMQEVLVSPNRPVIENIFMGFDGLFRRNLPRRQRPHRAREVLAQITTTEIPLFALVEDIPLPQQQLVVIARALMHDPHVLILDEATAALDISERQTLFKAIKQRTAAGKIVIYISHRMDEVLELSDEVTVLRSGRKVATLPKNEVTTQQLIKLVQPDSATLMEQVDV